MKQLFNPADAKEILERLEKLTPQAKGEWGKMSVAQMLAHCKRGLEMAVGNIHPKRIFMGRLLGGFFKSKYTDERPFDRGSPTSKELVITGQPNFEEEKKALKELIRHFSEGKQSTASPHPFFGSLTPEQWSRGMYKHLDHHLRQFNA